MLIGDEVITGFGRTGNWWGCQTLAMRPTTISVAKQLTSAYAPLGAVMVPEHVYQAYVDHSAELGTFAHGFTYGGHPLACALGVAGHRNLPQARHRRPCAQAHAGLRAAHEANRRASADRRSQRFAALSAAPKSWPTRKRSGPSIRSGCVGPATSRLIEKNGAILRALGDTIAICPPMIISEPELNELFDRFEKGLNEAEAWIGKEGLRAA